MASDKDYLDFIIDQLSNLDGISYRLMMGEYILYFQGKVIGGIYDDRFLLKDSESARQMMPEATVDIPYEGAKPMLLVDNIEDKEFLKQLIESCYDELPEPRKK